MKPRFHVVVITVTLLVVTAPIAPLPISSTTAATSPPTGDADAVDDRDLSSNTRSGEMNNSTMSASGTVSTQATNDPVFNGFYRPQIDGRLYGHGTGAVGDVSIPEGRAAEWADGHNRSVTVTPDSAELATADGHTYTKVIPANDSVAVADSTVGVIAIGVRVTGVDWRSDGDNPLQSVTLTLDANGDETLSTGDLRLIASMADLKDGQTLSFAAQDARVYRNGEFAQLSSTRFENVSLGTFAVRSDAEGTTVETRVRLGLLRDRLRELDDIEYGSLNRTGYDLTFGTERADYSLTSGSGGSVSSSGNNYAIAGKYIDQTRVYNRAPINPDEFYGCVKPQLSIDCLTADLEIQDVEVYQSVQGQGTGLDLVRDKQTLVRVPVTHGKDESIPVKVTIQAYADTPGQGRKFLGTRTVTYKAPKGTPSPANMSNAATLQFPASWTQYLFLDLEVSVDSPDFYTNGDSATAEETLLTTYDLSVYRVRLQTRNPNNRTSVGKRQAVSAGLRERVPTSPRFTDLPPRLIGTVDGSRRSGILRQLTILGKRIQAGRTSALLRVPTGVPSGPPVDQIYGLIEVRGKSTPPWSGGQALSAIGSFFEATMAHEINHNIGDLQWSMHVSDQAGTAGGYGCGPAGRDPKWDQKYNDGDVHVRGWEPGSRIVPATEEDFMTYCGAGRWTSDYRWHRWKTRMRNFNSREPIHPDFKVTATEDLPPSGRQVLGQNVSTVRVVSGIIYQNGTGQLLPSFEQPGRLREDPDAIGNASKADVRLRVIRESGATVEVPIETDFNGTEGTESQTDHFSVMVADNATIKRVELIEEGTGEVLDNLSRTDYGVESAAIDVPEEFSDRDELRNVAIDLNTFGTDPSELHKLVLYNPSPGSNGIWIPYRQPSRDNSFQARFTELPGGSEARFLVLVSDGLRTEFVTSRAFAVPHQPPEVRILRNERYEIDYADDVNVPTDPGTSEIRNVAGPVNVTAGEFISLNASVEGTVDPGPNPTLQWTLVDNTGETVATDTGKRFVGPDSGYLLPGKYTLSVIATDPESNLTNTDSIAVEVSRSPLPNATLVRTFNQGVQAAVDATTGTSDPLSLAVTNASTTPNATVTVEFNLTNTNETTLTGPSLEVTNLPAEWTVVNHSNAGASYTDNPPTFTWEQIAASESKTPSITLMVPNGAELSTYRVTARARTTGDFSINQTGTITVAEPTDPRERALQIVGVDDPAAISQNDVTATITRFNRGQSVNGMDIAQDDVTALITLFERNN